jgi:hypothetical protein
MNPRIGEVHETADICSQRGFGFVLYDGLGRPCAAFDFQEEGAAREAAGHIAAALANCKSVRGYGVLPPLPLQHAPK